MRPERPARCGGPAHVEPPRLCSLQQGDDPLEGGSPSLEGLRGSGDRHGHLFENLGREERIERSVHLR